MGKIYKVGIIGCGRVANKYHMPSLKKLENVELVAFCDLIQERAEKARADYGTQDAMVYTDYKMLLADDSIDIVHVCTPNRSHSFITIDALEMGKHVMCEKPMAKTYQEAKAMLDAAQRTGKKLTIGYQSRHSDPAQYIKHTCESGALGEIYYAKALAVRRRGVPTWGVFLDKEEQGGGPLIDIGTHALDLTLWLIDNYKPKMVMGTSYQNITNRAENMDNYVGDWDPEKISVEDAAFGFIVMENGATIVLESSWALNIADPIEAKCVLCGTEAGADMYDGARINGVRDGKQYLDKAPVETGDSATNKQREIAAWIEAIDKDINPIVLPEQALVVTRILEAIYESARTGKPVYFND